MIRPVTLLCALIAAGSGLYLYHAKHRVRLLDIEIRHTVSQTRQAEARVAILQAEWEDLNRPDRLQALAAKFLNLQPAQPDQFVSLAQLASRLPPVVQPAPAQPDQIQPDQGQPPAAGKLVADAAPPPVGTPAAAPVASRPDHPAPVALVADTVPLRPPSPGLDQRPIDQPHLNQPHPPRDPLRPVAARPEIASTGQRPDFRHLADAARPPFRPLIHPAVAPRPPVRAPEREFAHRVPPRMPTPPMGARIVRTFAPVHPHPVAVLPVAQERPYIGSALAAIQLPPPVPVRSDGR